MNRMREHILACIGFVCVMFVALGVVACSSEGGGGSQIDK